MRCERSPIALRRIIGFFNRFESYLYWAIELLSPDQAQTRPLEILLHCADQGTELGWLLDPEADSILTLSSESQLKLYRGSEPLPVLSGVALALSVKDVFGLAAST